MRNNARLDEIARVRRAVFSDGPQPMAMVDGLWSDRGWIIESWRRCLARGARPDESFALEHVSRTAAAHASESHGELRAAAQSSLRQLASAVAPIRYFALLTDAQGRVLETAGAIDRHDRHVQAIARIGVDLSERSIGTSAIGAALGERVPVWLHRGEHFFHGTSIYSCAGAPVFDPAGQCVGMVDVTGVEAPERPELRHLVAQSARQIEDALVLARPHRLRLRLAWPAGWQVSGGGVDDGLLCLDAEGCVTGANQTARQMLPALHALAHEALHAEALFALPWMELFDLARRGEVRTVPLWSGLRLQVAAEPASPPHASATQARPDRGPASRPSLKTLETELIHQAVRDAGGRVAEAARALGLSRATVYRRLAATRRSPG
ncbi:MAG TPA: helix-turn-helix domain-containing protein [Ottowia sp.]|uniref:helix-turn-helix domain-containing protein n=1 Tax=Ottowia sp. TaxID=1898956 RepID=UPI002C89E39C|nr:helix-turn-helix domain-containing protein [Ottowia sp.]HMN20532.1 helix-turn-helix domain-containing protein [Ottowia sp.]